MAGQNTTNARAGMLLVASPALNDPNFVDSVVLLLDVNDDGALGVILNRPSVGPVGEVLAAWSEAVTDPEVLFRGGPVGLDGALGIAHISAQDLPPGFRPLEDATDQVIGLGLVDLDAPVELFAHALAGLRIFAGYAGWGAEQLAGEIDRGDWYVVPAEVADVFRDDPVDLWRDVLRRQPGDLAFHATRPVDPDLN
jgi:putative transcriptional regulator